MIEIIISLKYELPHSVPVDDVATALSVKFEQSREFFLHQITNKTNKAKVNEAITSISEKIIVFLGEIMKYLFLDNTKVSSS